MKFKKLIKPEGEPTELVRKLMPMLSPTPKARDRVRVITASQLTPDMLKRNDIVYVDGAGNVFLNAASDRTASVRSMRCRTGRPGAAAAVQAGAGRAHRPPTGGP